MRRAVHSLLVSLLAAAGLVALAVMPAAAGPESGARLTASPGGNPLGMSNSKNGVAVLSAAGIAPGDPARSGTVTITNTGSVDGDFSLATANLRDTPGPYGGLLSSVLELRVDDVTAPASPVSVFRGKLGAMGAIALGEFRKRTGRTYRFAVSLPDGARPPSPSTGDNRFQGASVRADFVWTETKANGNGPKDKEKGNGKSGVEGTSVAGGAPGSTNVAGASRSGRSGGSASSPNGADGGSGGLVTGAAGGLPSARTGGRGRASNSGRHNRGTRVSAGSGGGGGLPFVGFGLAALALTGVASAASGLAMRGRAR